MKQGIVLAVTVGSLLLAVPGALAQVALVEPGHTLSQIVDSAVPLDPSQAVLDSLGPVTDIESIGIDPSNGDLFIQLQFPAGSFVSATTHIFRVSPSPVVGIVSPVAIGTGFGINSRGTDLHFDPSTGLLQTQDQNFGPGRIATVVPGTGVLGTWAAPFLFLGTSTFGMDISAGVGGSDVPAGEIIFTSDVGASGIHSTPLGGPVTTHLPPPIGAGDDLVIQPDGDWVHVGDFGVPFTAYNPAVPEPHVTALSPLNIAAMFGTAGLPFVFGSRATVCDSTGDLYVSYSGGFGGSGIFRVNEALTASTLVLTIGPGTEGLHDLTIGPSTSGVGTSVYFTVHDNVTTGEEVWEVTVPECQTAVDIKPGSDPNSINTKSNGVVPVAILGSAAFDVTTIDVTTLAFGPAGEAPAHDLTDPLVLTDHLQDVNGDGFTDLVSHYRQKQTGLAPGDTQACLTAIPIGGGFFVGCDAVRIVK